MSTTLAREKPLIMVVDDDLAARELLAAYLQPEGYTVMMVSSGAAAIEVAISVLPDLIVTDVLMPGAGGLQTLFVLKNTPETSKIPAIVVSGVNAHVLDLMPAAAYFVKPVERQSFVQAVRHLIPSSRKHT